MKTSTDALLKEALAHRALNHPYLTALEDGKLPNPKMAIIDFAEQYLAYSSWFPRYLTAAISKLDDPKHRSHLIENLAEESGVLEEEELSILNGMGIKTEWVQGVSHPELFKRFQRALDIDHKKTTYCDEAVIWRELFYNCIVAGSKEEAVGAIGIGTEAIVKYIYHKLIHAIKTYTDLTLEDYVFFELHTEVDDEHGKILLQIAEDMIQDEESLQEVRKGMLKALGLRSMFWDALYKRAMAMPNANVIPSKKAVA